jgi:hypothetical protein
MTSFVQQGTRRVPTGTSRVPQPTARNPQGGWYYTGGSGYDWTYPIVIDLTTGYLDPRINYTHSFGDRCYGFTSAGLLKLYGTTEPRFDYGPMGGGACRGLLIEATSTKRALWVRDGTNAVWTKSGSMTAAKTSTGIDGVAASCTLLTAASTNQTCLQTVTLGSSLRCFTAYVRRVTGTGTIEVTDNNGTNWTDITSSLSTTGWYRCNLQRTQANPVIGFRIGTSGDAIDFDCADVEDNNIPTTPILTGASIVQRIRDDAILSGLNLAPWFNPFEGTAVVDFILDYACDANTTSRRAALEVNENVGNERFTCFASNSGVSNNMHGQLIDGGSVLVSSSAGVKATASITQSMAFAYKLNDSNFAWNGSVGTADTACTMPSTFQMVLGGRVASGEQLQGVVSKVRYYNRRMTDAELQTVTSL